LRRVFRPKWVEVVGEQRKLHVEGFHNLYCSSNIRVTKSRSIRCTAHVACIGEMINSYLILVGKPGGKRPLERPRRRWEDKH